MRSLIDKTFRSFRQLPLPTWSYLKAAHQLMQHARAATAFLSQRSATEFSIAQMVRMRRAAVQVVASLTSSSVATGSAC